MEGSGWKKFIKSAAKVAGLAGLAASTALALNNKNQASLRRPVVHQRVDPRSQIMGGPNQLFGFGAPPTFHYETREGDEFSCRLKRQRCRGHKKNGARCSRNTIKMLPACWQHARSLYGVKVGRSTIPGAGDGLFAVRRFRKGDKVAPYTGERLAEDQVDEPYQSGDEHTAPYVLRVSRNVYVDSACERGLAAFANHNNAAHRNAKFSPNGAWVVATKVINPGQEIFVTYGPGYDLDNPNVRSWTAPYQRPPPPF